MTSLLTKDFYGRYNLSLLYLITRKRTGAVADPGFAVGGSVDLVGGGPGLPRRICFVKFVCQSERIGSLRGGTRRVRPPLKMPMWWNNVKVGLKTRIPNGSPTFYF